MVGPMAVLAQRVRQLRARKQLTAQQLADKLRQQGIPWDRATVTKLETGRRQNLAVTELLALALVLDVAPINLLVPLDDSSYQVTPKRSEDADTVRAWVRGESPLPGTDERTFRAEVSLADLRREHTTTLEQQAELIARMKRIPLSAALREVADRLED